MREFGLKMCLFLFLASLSANRTELGVVTAAATGTILLWPLYRKWVGLSGEKRTQGGALDERGDPNFLPASGRDRGVDL
jgi:hypothetical protein